MLGSSGREIGGHRLLEFPPGGKAIEDIGANFHNTRLKFERAYNHEFYQFIIPSNIHSAIG